MAGEGLFFTGTVFKNNRDLLKEETTRQQLAMQKEELELKKQQLADKKKEARRKGSKAQIKDYSVEGMDPFLVDQFQSQVGQYQGFANENAMSIYDGDNDAKNQQLSLERDLTSNKSKYDSISNDLTSLNNLVTAGKADNLKLTEDGEYLYEYNWNQVQEAVNSGEMDLDQALEAYPIDSQSMVNESEFEDHISAMFDAEADSREGSKSYTSEDGFSRSESFITDDQFSRGSLKAIKSLTPDSNGNWDNIDSKKIYIGKEGLFKVGDNMLSGPEAFALEVKGITSISDEDGSTPFLDKLMPGSGPEQEELRNEYIQYLSKKYEDQARESYPPILGTSKKPTSEESSLSKKDIDFLSGPSKSTLPYGGVNLKFDAGMYDDVTDRNIEVNIVPESLLPGQGDLQEFFEKQYKDEVGDTNKSVKGQVTRLGLTADNVKVAAVKFGQEEYLIPYESISSEIQELKKTSVGYKIGLFESDGKSKSIDTSKYN